MSDTGSNSDVSDHGSLHDGETVMETGEARSPSPQEAAVPVNTESGQLAPESVSSGPSEEISLLSLTGAAEDMEGVQEGAGEGQVAAGSVAKVPEVDVSV